MPLALSIESRAGQASRSLATASSRCTGRCSCAGVQGRARRNYDRMRWRHSPKAAALRRAKPRGWRAAHPRATTAATSPACPPAIATQPLIPALRQRCARGLFPCMLVSSHCGTGNCTPLLLKYRSQHPLSFLSITRVLLASMCPGMYNGMCTKQVKDDVYDHILKIGVCSEHASSKRQHPGKIPARRLHHS